MIVFIESTAGKPMLYEKRPPWLARQRVNWLGTVWRCEIQHHSLTRLRAPLGAWRLCSRKLATLHQRIAATPVALRTRFLAGTMCLEGAPGKRHVSLNSVSDKSFSDVRVTQCQIIFMSRTRCELHCEPADKEHDSSQAEPPAAAGAPRHPGPREDASRPTALVFSASESAAQSESCIAFLLKPLGYCVVLHQSLWRCKPKCAMHAAKHGTAFGNGIFKKLLQVSAARHTLFVNAA